MQQGYISFVGTCYFYFMVIKPFLHAQALTEHAKKNKFSKWVKILGEKILLSIRLPLKREKTIRHRQHYTLCDVFMEIEGVPGSSAGKESACNVGEPCLIPGSGRSPGEGNAYSLQYSGLENSMDCIVHGITKNCT